MIGWKAMVMAPGVPMDRVNAMEKAYMDTLRDPDFVAELAPQRVLMMPEGTLDYWSDDYLDLVALA